MCEGCDEEQAATTRVVVRSRSQWGGGRVLVGDVDAEFATGAPHLQADRPGALLDKVLAIPMDGEEERCPPSEAMSVRARSATKDLRTVTAA